MRSPLMLAAVIQWLAPLAATLAEDSPPELRPAMVILLSGDDAVGRNLREMKVLEEGAPVPRLKYPIYSSDEWEYFGEPATDRPVCILEVPSKDPQNPIVRKVAICPLRKVDTNKIRVSIGLNSEAGLIVNMIKKINESDYQSTGDIKKYYRTGKDYVLIANDPAILDITPDQVQAFQKELKDNTLFSLTLNVAETPPRYWNQYPPVTFETNGFPTLSLREIPKQLERIQFDISRDSKLKRLELRSQITLSKSSTLTPWLEPFAGARSKYEGLYDESADLNVRIRMQLSQTLQELMQAIMLKAVANFRELVGDSGYSKLFEKFGEGMETTFLTGRFDFAARWTSKGASAPDRGAWLMYSVRSEPLLKLVRADADDTEQEARIAAFIAELDPIDGAKIFDVDKRFFLGVPNDAVVVATDKETLQDALTVVKNPYSAEVAQPPLMVSGKISWLAPLVLPSIPESPVKSWLEQNQAGDARFQMQLQTTEREIQFDVAIDDKSLSEMLRSELEPANNPLFRRPQSKE